MSHHILFIELLGGIGDVLVALPAIQSLAASHPDSALTVLTFSPGDELLRHHPLIHQIVAAPKGAARQAVEQILSAQRYDWVITDTMYEGIADWVEQSGAERTVTDLWRDPPADELTSDRFLKILQHEQLITATAASQHRSPQIHLTAKEQIALPRTSGPKLCLYPDAGMAIKRWPLESFITLGKQLQQQHDAHIFVPVGADEAQARAIAAQIPQAQVWPRGSLRQLAALLTQMDAVVAADTGPARIAAALDVPTVTLFGPSWGKRYGQPAPHINLQAYPNCPERRINFTQQVCWYSGDCPFAWRTCTALIKPEQVLASLGSLLKPSPTQLPNAKTDRPTQPTWRTAKNLLVIRLDNIGDVLMTSPALQAIKAHAPQSRLALLASPAGSQAAAVLPWIDEVITWQALWQDLGSLPFDPQREWQLVEQLAARHFDGAIIFTSFKQSPHPPALICQLAGIPLRLGESQEQDGGTLTHSVSIQETTLHQVERNLQLVASVGYLPQERSLTLAVPASDQVPSAPYILFNPWTSCQARTYPPERFVIAAHQLSLQTGWPVVVTGTASQSVAAAPLLKQLGAQGISRIGQTSLSDLVALVARAQIMLSNNTATLHIADATRTPSVILFSGTELASQWQPRHTRAVLLQQPTACSPCYQFTCPYQLECLDIPPETITQAALSLLGTPQNHAQKLSPSYVTPGKNHVSGLT
ncbi:MAG: glycosyltransferase family 9 protein [Phormidesmis sp.]